VEGACGRTTAGERRPSRSPRSTQALRTPRGGNPVERAAGSALEGDDQLAGFEARALIERAPDAICIFDADSARFVEANPAAERLFGRSRSEILALMPTDLSPPFQPDGTSSMERIVRTLEEVRAGATIELDWVVLRPDGTEVMTEAQITRLPSEHFRARASLRDVTERRREQAALHASEQLYRTIVENASEGIAMVDLDYRVTFANERMADMLGRAVADIIGSKIEDLATPEGRDLILEGRRSRLSGKAGRYEVPMQHACGHTVWCQLSAAPLRDEHGEIVGAVGMHTDITQRKLDEARFKALAENASDMVAIMDANLRFVWASAATERVLGFPVEQVVQMTALDLVHPDDLGIAADGIAEVMEHPGRTVRRELRVMRADGSNIHGEVLGANYLDDPVLNGIVLSTRDVSDRKHAEQLLQLSEARNRSIVETAADGIITIDPSGRIESFNRAAEAIFSWTAAEAIGTPAGEFLSPESHARVAAAIDAGDGIGIACDALRRDGTTFPIELSISEVTVLGTRTLTAIVRDVTVQRAFEARLEALALHDTLTGLPNRRRLLERIEEAIARGRRNHGMLAVLFCDLDRFKIVNDSLGHEAGDQLLILAAARIGSVIRDTDTFARLGGDEFVVLCDEIEAIVTVTEIAQRIAAALEAPFELNGSEAFVSASIGIALWTGGAETPIDLLRNADTAMYRAKDGGRNRFEIFDEAMQAWAAARLDYESALRRAIERDELRVHYQPVVDLATGAVVGAEALVRWARAGLGLLAPGEFIALAEETGLIVPIGAWVLERAVHDCAAWQAIAPGVSVSVNLSPRQLATVDLVGNVVATLGQAGLAPGLLGLEITENIVMEDAPRNLDTLHELRDAGIRLALDDFGTGYSSLTYLRRFPIDTLKIDQSFVRSLGDHGDSTIVRAIVDLAHALELTVVAEGIDSELKLATLRGMGCEIGQGYLFARPEPIEALRERLAHHASARRGRKSRSATG
jgi:diguanylate cyclase (GGDEF)-like protein/PAS domain S-box-containing protein